MRQLWMNVGAVGCLVAVTAIGCTAAKPSVSGTATPLPTISASAPPSATTAAATTGRAQDLTALAAEFGVPADQLQSMLVSAMDQRIDVAAAAGTVTADQANQLKQRFANGVPFGGGFGRGRGAGGTGAPSATGVPGLSGTPPGGARPAFVNPLLTAAAAVIGIDEPTLQSQIDAGKTVAQVAQDHGKSTSDLLAGMATQLTPILDRLVVGGGGRPRGTRTPAASSS